MSRAVWVAGGEPAVAEAVAQAVRSLGREARMALEVPPGPLESAAALIDLGLPPERWPAGASLIDAEEQRARLLLGALPAGVRSVRASVLGAHPRAPSLLQRAQAAAEEAHRARGADAVVLRAGVLLGPCGICASLRESLERRRVLLLAGISLSRLEPLHVEDFARYCARAAVSGRSLEPVYDVGCGEVLTGGLLARGLAENLGLRRWFLPLPGFARGLVGGALARPLFPRVAVVRTLECLHGGLLPRGLKAWEHFDVRPMGIRSALARATGMLLPLRRRGGGRFGAWRSPRKRGILWRKK